MYVVAVLSMRKCNNAIESLKLLRNHFTFLGLKEAKDLSDFIFNTFEFNSEGSLKTKKDESSVRYLGIY